MNTAELENLKSTIRKCLDNAEDLLDSAKDCRNKFRNHIAFHLTVLSLEEVGKASMILARTLYPRVVEGDDTGESNLAEALADHKKKLFWALLTPSIDKGIISPEDFVRLKEVANEIHLRRVTSLYVDTNPQMQPVEISDDELTNIMALTESRLNLEELKEIRQLDASGQQLLDWFMKALSDPQLQSFVLGDQSRQKLVELTGDSRMWMTWLQSEINTAETKASAQMEKELNRLAPTGVLANKPKWRLKIKLHTLSHSVRHKELRDWNEQVQWVKLYPTNDKSELLVEFLLPAKIPLKELWKTASQMCSMFAVALNIGTAGYFWWYLPESPLDFFEEMVDLDSKLRLGIGNNSSEVINLKRTVLKSNQLHTAGTILTYLMLWATEKQSMAYSRYMSGVSLLSRNDVFRDFSEQAAVDFAHSFRLALTAFGDWDSDADTFEQAAGTVFKELWGRQEFFEEFKGLMDCANEFEHRRAMSRPIGMDEAMKLKAFCDGYLGVRARMEVQKAIEKRHLHTERARE